VNPLAGLNSFMGQTINYAQSLPKRQSLDPILKHRLSLYFRSLVPILKQSLRITCQLVPQVELLQKSLTANKDRAELQEWLATFTNTKCLTQQFDPLILNLELKQAVSYALQRLQITGAQEDPKICLVLNQATFSRNQFLSGYWQYHGYMD